MLQNFKGLRKEAHSLLCFFYLEADALSILLERAKWNGLFKGLIPDLVEDGLAMLKYADDTIFLLQDDFESASNQMVAKLYGHAKIW